MELFLLLGLAGLLSVWGIGEAADAWDDDDPARPDRPEDAEDQRLRGEDGTDDLLEGGAGDDTLNGNDGDADTLIGNAGDDRLVMGGRSEATGGDGEDDFVLLSPGSTITDFEPGEDKMRFVTTVPAGGTVDDLTYSWIDYGDGIALQQNAAGEGPGTTIVSLTGLDTPPPVADIRQSWYDEEGGLITRTGDNLTFVDDPRDLVLRSGNGRDDVVEGGPGDDLISSGPEDADTLIGNAGDDRLVMQGDNVATGGPGADVFVANGLPGTITDFTPGEDQLRFEHLDTGSALAPVYDWRVDDEGVTLERVAADGARSDIATLAGLDTPPPAEDLLQVERSAETGQITGRTEGADLQFYQRITGTDGPDSVVLDDPDAMAEADLGAGSDSATVAAQRADFDLGPGNDNYTSRTEVSDDALAQSGRPEIYETVTGGAGNDLLSAGEGQFHAEGGAGDDIIDLHKSLVARADGGPGDDRITGTENPRYSFQEYAIEMNGGEGDDTIYGAWQDDQGNFAPEFMDGGPGDDLLRFGEFDRVTGGLGADVFELHAEAVSPSYQLPRIADFDPDEDALMVVLPPNYTGAGVFAVGPGVAGQPGSQILLDGEAIARSNTELPDDLVITVVT